MTAKNWYKCARALKNEISQGQFDTWIRPLSPKMEPDGKLLWVVAPNRFILDWVQSKFMSRIRELMREIEPGLEDISLKVAPPRDSTNFRSIGANGVHPVNGSNAEPRFDSDRGFTLRQPNGATQNTVSDPVADYPNADRKRQPEGEIDQSRTFSNFVVGQSNRLARSVALQVAENPGRAYNPLFIYGGVGLGKTHLMHAVGNQMLAQNPGVKVKFVDCEAFVNAMIRALRFNAMDEFKRYFRSVDALLLDDIHFLSRKERSQEEFFHTFNSLLDGKQQIVLTCDRYHKAIEGIEPRLKSRFGWGLSVAVEPLELETRVAILMSKARAIGLRLPDKAAMFIAQKVCGSGRELEGAIKKVNACAQFKGAEVDIDLVKEALWDLFAQRDKLITIDSIQRTVAQYYKINMRDMLSRRRSLSVTRPRQIAMSLARELANHSYPEIGEAFGGRDHTTVLHACRKVKELRRESKSVDDDFNNLLRTLTN